ncbi:hypothetical protein SAY86_023533 [Trapa natans]|uniref:Uncharacterized protein n=1 Tax=Trapa natans TaxID=22666 RepID=A0AAN7RBL3_TRANT|nr:hypothetical protein SAY86_023533 [Trapa natans]
MLLMRLPSTPTSKQVGYLQVNALTRAASIGDDRFQSAQRFFGGKEADLQSLLMFVEESAKEAHVLNNIILSFICQMLELVGVLMDLVQSFDFGIQLIFLYSILHSIQSRSLEQKEKFRAEVIPIEK